MISAFPDPYPDELFYSVCARYVHRLAYRRTDDGLADLFGRQISRPGWALPNCLGRLVARLPEETPYTVPRILQEHTLLPFYRLFMPAERLAKLERAMEDSMGGRVLFQIGLAKVLRGSMRYMRFCPSCADDDRRVYGEPYWHRLHQLPGVELCPRHLTFLENSPVRINDEAQRRQVVLAKRVIARSRPRPADESSPADRFHIQVARDAQWLFSPSAYTCEPANLIQRYMQVLVGRGLATYSHSVVHHKQLVQGFLQFYPTEFLRAVDCEVRVSRRRWSWLRYVLRLDPSVAVRPPIYHLLLMQFLGHTAESFFELPAEPPPFGLGPWPCLNPVCPFYRKAVIATCVVTPGKWNGGRPRGCFACTCGFVYGRRGPDRNPADRDGHHWIEAFGPDWDRRFAKLWMDPAQSFSSLTRCLGPQLKALRCQAVRLGLPLDRWGREEITVRSFPEQTQTPGGQRGPKLPIDAMRTAWLSLQQQNPMASLSELNRLGSSIGRRLRNWDRAWYDQHSPKWKRGCKQYGLRQATVIRWWCREQELVTLIHSAVAALHRQSGRPRRITPTLIREYLQLGRACFSRVSLTRYPEVRRLLAQVTEPPLDFAVRSITWTAHQLRVEGRSLSWSSLLSEAHLDRRTVANHPRLRRAMDAAVEKRDLPHPGRPRRAA